MFNKCIHKWKILSETVTESKFEHASKQIPNREVRQVTIPHQMCDASRKLIQIVTCEKCGKLKRFVESI